MKKANDFFMSNKFIAIVFSLNVVFWWLKTGIVLMVLAIVFLVIAVIFNLNRMALIPLLFANIISYRSVALNDNLVIMIVIGIIIVPLILYDLFSKYKINFKDKIVVALFVFLLINIMSLINTNSETILLGVVGVSQILLYTLVYLYFSKHKNKDAFVYFAKNASAMGIAIFIQLMILIVEFDGGIITKNDMNLGWGVSNYVAMLVTMLIPLTFYLYIRNQKNMFALLAVGVEFLVIIITQSKGALLAWVLAVIPFIIFAYIYAKNKKLIIIHGSMFLGVIIVGVFFISRIDSVWSEFIEYFTSMSTRGWFNDENRLKLYSIGFDLFKENPLLGAGSYTGQYYIKINNIENINYHNYVIQTIATVGLLGLINFGYLLYLFTRKTLQKNFMNISVLFIIILFSIHGLVDTTWYNPLLMIPFFIIMAIIPTKDETTELVKEID